MKVPSPHNSSDTLISMNLRVSHLLDKFAVSLLTKVFFSVFYDPMNLGEFHLIVYTDFYVILLMH